ncbi:hypothetical protein IV203_013955 [Nitzschia inconspicua]|uniref:Transcription initiation factor IIF subunit alpha n=1 Tax=Nitzschia inconspicua TaxID=303405 RepID=A0A9K3Q962_9STRA|nr:hypothetical protein IV203_013955 [Nitzschia inconspicua]
MSFLSLSTSNTSSSSSGGGVNLNSMNAQKKYKAPGSGLGVDTLLTERGKQLSTGQEVRFLLIKGPSRPPASDPVNPKAPKESFPLIAKFSESVVKPKFDTTQWKTARLYQQDIPKAEEDSDDEDAAATAASQQPKKRWRSRNPKDVGRQWVLQEQVEFLETMMAKRQKAASGGGTGGNPDSGDGINGSSSRNTSTRYEGTTEHNPSHYILLETMDNNDINHHDDDNHNTIRVTTLPTNATIAFSQPKATNTLSMSEAEMAIQNQRGKFTRFMMHDQQRVFQGQPPVHQSRTRLLGKLLPEQQLKDGGIDPKTGKKKSKRRRLLDGDDDDDDDDDVMTDLAFRNRKGNAKARKELLTSFGDDGMKVDADGVLGGTNDGMFGQRGQKFGRFQVDPTGAAADANDTATGTGMDGDEGGGTAGVATTEKTSNDGLAMADDFYQRDVQAEYEELDYDANEQFDDDDVDVGETEVVMDDSAFNNDDDDDDDLDEETGEERLTGAEGLASLAGFRLMLAKARGEITPEQAAEMAVKNKKQAEEADKREAEKKSDGNSSSDYVAEIIEKAEQARKLAEEKAVAVTAIADDTDGANGAKGGKKPSFTGKEVDELGQRMITLEAVRREIWLNDGKIPMKRLMKIFDVKKKSAQDRQVKFKEAVRELCMMETDPVGGRMLVLKQHYRRANM